MKPTLFNHNLSSHRAAPKLLLICGSLSSVLYVVMNIVTALLYPGYNSLSQTVSELSAIGAPTRSLWMVLAIFYGLLTISFGYGVWLSGEQKRPLRIAGTLLMINGFIGFFWPPMHLRQVLAAGGGTLTDTLHIAFTMVAVLLMMLVMIYGAMAFGSRFRVYTIISLAILITFGVISGLGAPDMEANRPTPLIGLWERINIAAYMFWINIFCIALLRTRNKEEQVGEQPSKKLTTATQQKKERAIHFME